VTTAWLDDVLPRLCGLASSGDIVVVGLLLHGSEVAGVMLLQVFEMGWCSVKTLLLWVCYFMIVMLLVLCLCFVFVCANCGLISWCMFSRVT